ncbi:MAG: DNA polymerase III subunit gamma/tau, partial [Actinobacteria bacterium]|nr:DNA polymerase III subunit gamma/tau [Actinomycetota bacterium]NBR67395.1 DNA polymerase III subunit gamma/tau [Actinomycetota bacterium]
MALDTKFRPTRFDDVIGQDASVKVLRQFVRSGTGFHQSYVFCGFHGSGKCVTGDT